MFVEVPTNQVKNEDANAAGLKGVSDFALTSAECESSMSLHNTCIPAKYGIYVKNGMFNGYGHIGTIHNNHLTLNEVYCNATGMSSILVLDDKALFIRKGSLLIMYNGERTPHLLDSSYHYIQVLAMTADILYAVDDAGNVHRISIDETTGRVTTSAVVKLNNWGIRGAHILNIQKSITSNNFSVYYKETMPDKSVRVCLREMEHGHFRTHTNLVKICYGLDDFERAYLDKDMQLRVYTKSKDSFIVSNVMDACYSLNDSSTLYYIDTNYCLFVCTWGTVAGQHSTKIHQIPGFAERLFQGPKNTFVTIPEYSQALD